MSQTIKVKIPALSEADQRLADDWAERLNAFLQQHPQRRPLILGTFMASVSGMQTEIAEDSELMTFYVRCFKLGVDAIAPRPIPVPADEQWH